MTVISRTSFPVKLSLRIDWSEMDLFSHVNNVMILKYIQSSRINYWETIGLTKIYEEEKIGPMLISTSCQFKRQLHYPGMITVQAGIEYIKNTSFGIHHQVLNSKGEIAAEAQDVVLVYDFNKNEKVAFPPRYRKLIGELEKRKI